MRKILSILAVATIGISSSSSVIACQYMDKNYTVPEINNDLYTTVFHQQNPTQGMLNDIQGGFFDEETQEWHVYFLQNSDGLFDKYGYNHGKGGSVWYHATTKDWINWENHGPGVPKTIKNYNDQASGTFFEDVDNLFGLDPNYIKGQGKARTKIAVTTNYNGKGNQDIMMFYSIDGGYTFDIVKDELILENPNRGKNENFRDPYFFYDKEKELFVMYIARGEFYDVYSSKTPTEGYKKVGSIDVRYPMLECSNLFQMNVKDENGKATGEKKWVLIYGGNGNHGDGKDNLSGGTYYSTGTLDENDVFIPDSKESVKRLDFGPDYYAAKFMTKSVENTNIDSLITTGWMSNWAYTYQVPNDGRFGYMSLARNIELRENNNDYTMHTDFVDFWSENKSQGSVKTLSTSEGSFKTNEKILESNSLKGKSFKMNISLKDLSNFKDTLKLTIGDDNYKIEAKLDFVKNKITVNRKLQDKLVRGNKEFTKNRVYSADLSSLKTGEIEIYLDKTTLEFKFPDGSVYSMLKFPDNVSQEDIEVTSNSQIDMNFKYYQIG
ncbi:levanase [Spiroplasma chinense]|uniref:Levanase n=1 Tax=Spiroplasma chinense TaxID=216932 RepID=A0A5B9Y532_9MOLU|nr:glycoside hydrolase family 32 protein [Spiroplasma chinense]QEH61925.1 levanase [Spiroplasma chinense]